MVYAGFDCGRLWISEKKKGLLDGLIDWSEAFGHLCFLRVTTVSLFLIVAPPCLVFRRCCLFFSFSFFLHFNSHHLFTFFEFFSIACMQWRSRKNH
ncbi:hypothetical protein DFH27DRAFT_92197 [Peziza echinospora]|nr:hypothetical protein DFH27DRAFT_92197 [Peziza echinospora]